jgi:hypothetical protein
MKSMTKGSDNATAINKPNPIDARLNQLNFEFIFVVSLSKKVGPIKSVFQDHMLLLPLLLILYKDSYEIDYP